MAYAGPRPCELRAFDGQQLTCQADARDTLASVADRGEDCPPTGRAVRSVVCGLGVSSESRSPGRAGDGAQIGCVRSTPVSSTATTTSVAART